MKGCFWFILLVLLGLSLVIWGFSSTMDAMASSKFTKRDAYSIARPVMHKMCDDTPICGKAHVYGCTRKSPHRFTCTMAQAELRREGGGCFYQIIVTPETAKLTGRFACVTRPNWSETSGVL